MIDSTVVLAQIDSALEDHRSLRLATAVESLIESAAPAYNCRDYECTCHNNPYRWVYESAFPHLAQRHHPFAREALERAYEAWRWAHFTEPVSETFTFTCDPSEPLR